MDVINEIETNNNPFQDGLDYYMDCIVNVNNVRVTFGKIASEERVSKLVFSFAPEEKA